MRACLAMLALTWPWWLLLAVTGAFESWQARTVRPATRHVPERPDYSAEEAAYRAELRKELERG